MYEYYFYYIESELINIIDTVVFTMDQALSVGDRIMN